MSTLYEVLYKETKNRPKTISERNKLIRDASRPVGTRKKFLDEDENCPQSPISPQTPVSPKTPVPSKSQFFQQSPISTPSAEYPPIPNSPIPSDQPIFKTIPAHILPEETVSPTEAILKTPTFKPNVKKEKDEYKWKTPFTSQDCPPIPNSPIPTDQLIFKAIPAHILPEKTVFPDDEITKPTSKLNIKKENDDYPEKTNFFKDNSETRKERIAGNLGTKSENFFQTPNPTFRLNIKKDNNEYNWKTPNFQEDLNTGKEIKMEGKLEIKSENLFDEGLQSPSRIRRSISQALQEAKMRKLREQLKEEDALENLRLDSSKLLEFDKILLEKENREKDGFLRENVEGCQRLGFNINGDEKVAEFQKTLSPQDEDDIPFPEAKSRIAFFERLKK